MGTTALPIERRLLGMGLRLGAVVLLSTLILVVKLLAARGTSMIEIMFWRQFFAVPVLLALVLAGPGLASLKSDRFGVHVRRSAMGLTGMVFNFGAIIMLPLAESTTIGFTMPLFATFFSALLLKEQVGRHRWSAVLIGFIGIVIVAQPGQSHIPLTGVALGLSAAFMLSLISIQIRDLTRTESTLTIAFWFSALCTVPLALLMPFVAKPHDGQTWLLFAASGVVGALGQLGLTASLRYAPVSTVIGMDYSSLIWTSIYGWVFWSAVPSPSTWIGAPLIIASGLYIAWREHLLSIERSKDIVA